MNISEQVALLEAENERLRGELAHITEHKPAENPATTRILDLLAPEIEWQEEHLKDIPKYKREWWGEMIKAYRELRPRGI